jgi:hypothetical protein
MEMDWRKLFSPSDATAAANPIDVTGTNGAPCDGSRAQSVVVTPVAADNSVPRLSEAVKRRQVALLVNYVMAIRAR